jgi:hypothetical protein
MIHQPKRAEQPAATGVKRGRPVGKCRNRVSGLQHHVVCTVVPQRPDVTEHRAADPRRVRPRRARLGIRADIRIRRRGIRVGHPHQIAQPERTVAACQVSVPVPVRVLERRRTQSFADGGTILGGYHGQVRLGDTLETDVLVQKQLVHDGLVLRKIHDIGVVCPRAHAATASTDARSIQRGRRDGL